MSDAPRILLVDDDLQVVRFLKMTLEDSGYIVTAVTTVKQALANLKEPLPDVLILDLSMPEPDGFDLLKAVRYQFPDLKVLVISGYLDGALLEAATLLGAAASLEKPITAAVLDAKLQELLGSPRKPNRTLRRSVR
jgi:CheY-like chemotaxis protein